MCHWNSRFTRQSNWANQVSTHTTPWKRCARALPRSIARQMAKYIERTTRAALPRESNGTASQSVCLFVSLTTVLLPCTAADASSAHCGRCVAAISRHTGAVVHSPSRTPASLFLSPHSSRAFLLLSSKLEVDSGAQSPCPTLPPHTLHVHPHCTSTNCSSCSLSLSVCC